MLDSTSGETMLIILGYVQKRYGLSTKTMFNAVAVGIILLAAWGIIGIFTQVRLTMAASSIQSTNSVTETRI
jgi:hypothetical protein